ncbi:MAG: hypothetical protein ACT4PT_04665 [Methanobacteriota archaeon]
MRRLGLALALVLLVPALPAVGGRGAPLPRHDAGLAFSREMGSLVLHGGVSEGVALQDTWPWDGRSWVRVESIPKPLLRPGFAMAEDIATRPDETGWKGTILLAGLNPAGAFETWELSSGQWALRSTAGPDGPPLLDKSVSSFRIVADLTGADPDRMLLVLSEPGLGTEVWKWNGTSWTDPLISSYPSAREGFGVAFFFNTPTEPSVIHFGGVDPATGERSADTAGRTSATGTWRPMVPAHQPPATSHMALSPPSALCSATLFGGETAAGRSRETWCWRLFGFPPEDWFPLPSPHSPPARSHATMARSVDGESVWLFGGVGEDGRDRDDLWNFGVVCERKAGCFYDWVKDWPRSGR